MRADRLLLAACCVLPLLAGRATAQEMNLTPRQQEILSQIEWQEGPLEASLGSVAKISVPEGFVFVDANDARLMAELDGEPPTNGGVGLLLPEDGNWQIVFSYDPIGYVNEDEQDDLDADAILETIREGTRQANEYRRANGGVTLEVVGWDAPPYYDPQTNRLTWALLGRGAGEEVVNYNTRLLGRGGVMSANLIASPQDLSAAKAEAATLMNGFAFNVGQRHEEFQPGDKLAEYGLTGLIVGGGLAVAAKSGLLGKLLKPLLIGGAALLAFVGKFWRKLTGQAA